jgi:protein-disulfide isomerase
MLSPTRVLVSVAALAVAALWAGGVWVFAVQPSSAASSVPPMAAAIEADELAQGASAIVLGNPGGDVTIVEYFDYQCPACRRVHPVVGELAAEDRNVRVVHKHWPVFGPVSVYAARIAFAARWQGRYDKVHDALFEIGGRLDEEKIRRAAAGAGLDLVRAERDLKERGAEVDAALAEVEDQAARLQLRGTPRFVVGPYVTAGSLNAKGMREMVRKVRGEAKRS